MSDWRSARFALAIVIVLTASGCVLRNRPPEPTRAACPRPDTGGMSQRLADAFYHMSRDTGDRAILQQRHIDPDLITVPVLILDDASCARISARFRLSAPSGSEAPSGAEGGAFYTAGPYVIYAPWRDYNRQAEWTNKTEFAALVVMDADLKLLGAFAM